MYTYDTLVHYLSNGYSSPTGIPYNDAEIPPFDDPVTVDPRASSSRLAHRHGSFAAFAFIKLYMLQIIAYVASMDGHLIEI